jgi:hypothetical protein
VRNDSPRQRNRIKSYLFRGILLPLLAENDLVAVDLAMKEKYRQRKPHLIECRGRGTWHPIDCPMEDGAMMSLMGPVRFLSEIKFYAKPVSKQHIREFVGTINDIQANYWMAEDFNSPIDRVCEVGVFFAANGFTREAERLAFAHNIKLVAYKGNAAMRQIIALIETLEKDCLLARACLAGGRRMEFMSLWAQILQGGANAVRLFKQTFDPAAGFTQIVAELADACRRIKSNFLAMTSGGAWLHFIGPDRFPADLFAQGDKQVCRMGVRAQANRVEYALTFARDRRQRKFFVTPPKALGRAVFLGHSRAWGKEDHISRRLHVPIRLDGIKRHLVLELENDWMSAFRDDAIGL